MNTADRERAANPWVREHYGFADLDRARALPTAERTTDRPRRTRRALATLAVATLGVGLVVGVVGHARAVSAANNGPGLSATTDGPFDHGRDGGRGRERR